MSLGCKVGRVFMLGFLGTSLDKDTVKFLTGINPGGIILFSRNFVSPAQLKELIGQIKELFDQRILIAIDHEGGRIIRFDQGVTVFPGNMALGVTGNRGFAFQQGIVSALELRNLGINVNLAPVLDVLTDRYNPGITIRSFSQDPYLVASLGVSMIEAMQSTGISATAKHFPGLGAAYVDPHLELPTVDLPYETTRTYLYPFIKAIEAGVDLVMSSHVVCRSLEQDLPATFSHNIVHDLLRKELGFRGIIITDDLEMGAIGKHYAMEEAVIRGVRAGHDMVLICANREYQKRGFDVLTNAYNEGILDFQGLNESIERIEALIDMRLHQRYESKAKVDGTVLAAQIARASVNISRDNKELIPIRTDGDIAIVYPDFLSLSGSIFFERDVIEGKELIRRYLKVSRNRIDFLKVPLEGIVQEAEVIKRLKKSNLIVFFCFEARAYRCQRSLLRLLERYYKQLIVILLGSPSDEELIGPDVSIIQTYGFRMVQIEAAINLLNP